MHMSRIDERAVTRPSLKDRSKTAAYRLGLLNAYHHIRNKLKLTTAMFHRVLPRDSGSFSEADPDYVLSTALFRDCLRFLRDHYNIISLRQLATAARAESVLPERPLLLTFDDGWADTLEHAAPELARLNLPAVCFVATDALDDPDCIWWQDTFGSLWRRGLINEERIREIWADLRRPPPPNGFAAATGPFLRSLAMVQELPDAARTRLLAVAQDKGTPHVRRQMLQPDGLRQLLNNNIEIGAHGATHLPLTLCRDVSEELTRSRRRLQDITGLPVTSMSFPHGRFENDMIDKANSAGYEFLFTSRQVLDRIAPESPLPHLFGRIEIAESGVTDGASHFRPERMATLMFLRSLG